MLPEGIKEAKSINIFKNKTDEFPKLKLKLKLRFNAVKCHVLHLGSNNNHFPYNMKRHDTDVFVELITSEVEKDLGVLLPNI